MVIKLPIVQLVQFLLFEKGCGKVEKRGRKKAEFSTPFLWESWKTQRLSGFFRLQNRVDFGKTAKVFKNPHTKAVENFFFSFFSFSTFLPLDKAKRTLFYQ